MTGYKSITIVSILILVPILVFEPRWGAIVLSSYSDWSKMYLIYTGDSLISKVYIMNHILLSMLITT